MRPPFRQQHLPGKPRPRTQREHLRPREGTWCVAARLTQEDSQGKGNPTAALAAVRATHAARWRTRSLLRDLCRKPYASQLFTNGQKRVLDGDLRCRLVSGLSSLAIKVPAAHFRARVLAHGQPH